MDPRRTNYWSLITTCTLIGAVFTTTIPQTYASPPSTPNEMRFIQVEVQTKEARSQLANMGMSLEAFRSDSVWGFANGNSIQKIELAGFKILGNFDVTIGRGGHETLDFPVGDANFHNYQEAVDEMKALEAKNPEIVKMHSIGKTMEGRDIWAMHFNSTKNALKTGVSTKPGVIFMGAHHAREHLSVEIPLMLIKHLLDSKKDAQIAKMLDTRDIWIIPMLNADGAEYDIQNGNYRWWRKNRRDNGDGTYGVDLNRNYGFKWGTGGSDDDTSSDIYMGKEPFSEPETQAIKTFVESHLNAKVLLTFHTFSELILYPWGHTYDSVGNNRDLQVFEKMARTMAGWNRYRPQQSSDLYITSGDTTDWAYGEHGIFAFTFELSPSSMGGGGFYPGQKVIAKVFQDNVKPCLYLIDAADDPYKVIDRAPSPWLKNYFEPSIPNSAFWEPHPLAQAPQF